MDLKVKKVLFTAPEDEGAVDETLWAIAKGKNLYQLDNVPFHAYDVSYGDVVYAPFDKVAGKPVFMGVHRKCGHRTIRIAFDLPPEGGNESDQLLQKLTEMGCFYEVAGSSYMCINIPPSVNFVSVCELLVDNGIDFEVADPANLDLFGE